MIISFDLDNTIIPYSNEFEVESISIFGKLIKAERIRKGTIELFKNLRRKNCEVWIYTTSYRSTWSIKKTFAVYGLRPNRIINGEENQKILNQNNCSSSKNPNLFGIDLHIDDLEGVKIESEKHKFEVLILKLDEENWDKNILKRIEQIKNNTIL